MTIKRTISRVLVTATVPAAMIMGAPAALAGEDSEKDRNHWVCEHDDFKGHWADHDDWESWKDEHCDDDNGNDHKANNADHDNNDDDEDRHKNNDDDHDNNDHDNNNDHK
jgi:hypothetical protein